MRQAGTARPSSALPVLLWGIIGGMLGGLMCCCWLAPSATSFFATRQVRKQRGPEAGNLLGVGFQTSFVASLLIATFGTAVYVWLNDPSGMSESRRAMFDMFGGGAGDVPLGLLALGYATMGFAVSFAVGLLGSLAGGALRGAPKGPGGKPPGRMDPSQSAARFLHQPAPVPTPTPTRTPTAAPAPQAPPVADLSPPPAAAAFAPTIPLPTPTAVPQVPPAPVPSPQVAEPEPEPPGDPGWDRFRRPGDVDRSASDLEVRAEELANQEEEAGAWDEETEP